MFVTNIAELPEIWFEVRWGRTT